METYIEIPSRINGEILGDYPSEFIKSLDGKWNATAYGLTQTDMKSIFDLLREQLEIHHCDDVDGQRCQIEYKVYAIDAIHHFATHEERGGDSYMGFYEPYIEIDRDSIEITNVVDEEGKVYLGWLNKLNDYAKRNNL